MGGGDREIPYLAEVPITQETSLIRHGTPIKEYFVEVKGKNSKSYGIPVYVKREDLSTLPPMPPLAKLRGAGLLLKALKHRGVKLIGHHDSWYSKAGWGIAVLCRRLELKCIVGYPNHRGKPLPKQLVQAADHGAELYGVRPNFIRINYAMTKRWVESKGGYMLPLALACPESTIAVAREANTVPEALLSGTLVISVGSGTILSGLLLGLKEYPQIYGVSAGMSEKHQRRNVDRLLFLAEPTALHYNFSNNFTIIPPSRPYEEQEDYPCPFPSHPNYDRKAWRWMCENIESLKQPILFWNIGA